MPMIDGTPFRAGCPCDEHVAMDLSAAGWGDRPGGGGEDDDAHGRAHQGVLKGLLPWFDRRLDWHGTGGSPPLHAEPWAGPLVDLPARGHGDGDYPHMTHELGGSPFDWLDEPSPSRFPATAFDDADHHAMRGGPDD